jgi:4-hydroxyphenylpyruvate dioxygenase-like putative hemolysin
MIEFDLDKTGYFSISEKGAFDMVDAQIILTPNEVEELKKALTLNDVSQQRELLEAYTKQIKEDNEFTEEITFQDINKCIASNCG